MVTYADTSSYPSHVHGHDLYIDPVQDVVRCKHCRQSCLRTLGCYSDNDNYAIYSRLNDYFRTHPCSKDTPVPKWEQRTKQLEHRLETWCYICNKEELHTHTREEIDAVKGIAYAKAMSSYSSSYPKQVLAAQQKADFVSAMMKSTQTGYDYTLAAQQAQFSTSTYSPRVPIKEKFRCEICDEEKEEINVKENFPFPVQKDIPIEMKVCSSCLSMMKRIPQKTSKEYKFRKFRKEHEGFFRALQVWQLIAVPTGGFGIWEALHLLHLFFW